MPPLLRRHIEAAETSMEDPSPTEELEKQARIVLKQLDEAVSRGAEEDLEEVLTSEDDAKSSLPGQGSAHLPALAIRTITSIPTPAPSSAASTPSASHGGHQSGRERPSTMQTPLSPVPETPSGPIVERSSKEDEDTS